MAAKKKKAKEKKTGISGFAQELVGLFVLLLMILMLGGLGWVGIFLRRLTVTMFGDFFWFFGLIIIAFSVHMIVARKKPSFFSHKYIGSYLVFFGAIIFAQTDMWRAFYMQRLSFTEGIGQYYLRSDVLADDAMVGGGIFGAFVWFILVELVTWKGLWFIAFILILYGILLICGLTIQDLYNMRKPGLIKNGISKMFTRIKASFEENKDTRVKVAKKELTRTSEKTEKIATRKEKVIKEKIEEKKEVPQFKINDFAENLAQQMEQKIPIKSTDKNYVLPPMSLLIDHETTVDNKSLMEAAKKEALRLEETFSNFDVRAKVSEVHIGPTVTRYEVTPDSGVKVNKITGLTDDIALALAVKGVRMEAPIPGKSAVGIEVPNSEAQMVSFKEMMDEMVSDDGADVLNIALGRDISGLATFAALNKMPHLLVAGATGSGKSVCINTMICSLLMRFAPSEVRLLLVDPKKVELARYNGLPHLLTPVVTDPQLASAALKKVVEEMERRYDLFAEAGCRDIASYNEWLVKEKAKREAEGIISTLEAMPFIVVILDELADLMMVAKGDVEDSIMRLTQMARAAGIHLVVATQRPSVDVITGVIKSNIPSRIAFGVSSGTDSRTILDAVGAEKLLGRGDMLFSPMGSPSPLRIQGAFIRDDEVARVVEFIKGQELGRVDETNFLDNIESSSSNTGLPSTDALIRDVLAFAYETQKVSTSMLQRRFKIGYNRAARIIDDLVAAGLVGESDGSKGRPVLMDETTYRELIS